MEVNEISSEEGTPIRSIFCLKRNMDLKSFEEKEDCFILDFNPYESADFAHPSVPKSHHHPHDVQDLSIIAEKGQVACRDYAHSRHLCLKLPFETTPHEKYCKLCYCYVCDLAAPCNFWTKPVETKDGNEMAHCDASENGDWKSQRRILKKQKSANQKYKQEFSTC